MKYIIRIDDITPRMNHCNFNILKDTLTSLDIKPIIGVVPDNKDENLNFGDEDKNFWDSMRELKQLGWTIAQHGYRHEYVSRDAGLLDINQFSEFSGLGFQEQLSKIQSGKRILLENDIWEPVFMAPGHSFDKTTLAALEESNFNYVTDGLGLYPWQENNLIFVPQVFSSFTSFGFGIYTVCLHINKLSEEQIQLLIKRIKENRKNIICLSEAVLYTKKPSLLENTFMYFVKHLLKMKRGF